VEFESKSDELALAIFGIVKIGNKFELIIVTQTNTDFNEGFENGKKIEKVTDLSFIPIRYEG